MSYLKQASSKRAISITAGEESEANVTCGFIARK